MAWRAWRVARYERGLALISAVYDDVWHPGHPFAARCPGEHAAPTADCECGVHATRTRAGIRRYLVGRLDRSIVAFVGGQVSLWGNVVECARGWRGEHAYPFRVWVPPERPELVDALASYGVPISLARLRLPRASLAHNGDHHDEGGDSVDDPREEVPDELEERLDNLSATLTDDDITTSTDTGTRGVLGDADDTDADDADADADADDADDTGL